MMPLAIALIAVAAGLALVALAIELFDRELDRRARLRLERQQRAEQLMWQRLDWVTGPSAPPEQTTAPGVEPRAPGVEPRVAERAPSPPVTRATTGMPGARSRVPPVRVPARASASEPVQGVLSPRRLLWRDTVAVLFIAVLAGFLYSTFVAPPGEAPTGGVLGATSSPAASPSPGASATPGASVTATSRPTHHASTGNATNPTPIPSQSAPRSPVRSPDP